MGVLDKLKRIRVDCLLRCFAIRRRKSISHGLLRTAPFVAAGMLSLVLYYSRMEDHEIDWSVDGLILLIFVFLCWTVYFTVSQQIPYSKRNVIDDLLLATIYQLGQDRFRINIMELRQNDENPYNSFFQMTYYHGYQDPDRYKEKIDLSVPGASDAYKNRETVYLGQKQLKTDIDPNIRHLWSTPIIDRRGLSAAVLNIDNYADDKIDENLKERLEHSIEKLSELISYYWEISI